MATKSKKKPVDIEELDIEISDNTSIELDDIDLDDDEIDVEISVEAEAPPAKKETSKKAPAKVPSSSAADLIVDLDEGVNWLTLAYYGKNGTGKTHLGATTEGALILPIEEGTLTVRKMGDSGKVKKLPVLEWQMIEDVYWMLKGGKATKDGIVIKTRKGDFTVKVVVFDTLTRLIQVCLRSVVLGAAATDPTKDVVSPTLRDWGIMSQKMMYWLMMYEELPVHKVWMLQETSQGEAEDDEFSIFPDMNKALRNFVMAEADVIGRTCIIKHDGEMKHAVKFGANNRFVTKDRTGDLGKTWVNPRLDKMLARALGK